MAWIAGLEPMQIDSTPSQRPWRCPHPAADVSPGELQPFLDGWSPYGPKGEERSLLDRKPQPVERRSDVSAGRASRNVLQR